MNHRLSQLCIFLAGFFACFALTSTAEAQNLPIPTTLQDWAQPGTQPGVLVDPIIAGSACNLCHSAFSNSPVDSWKTSIMAQAGRDPIFHACLAIANQDAAESGDLCLRCHAPGAWLAGNSTPTDGSNLSGINDFDGVTCTLCHRMVDPEYVSGQSPSIDLGILNNLAEVPEAAHTGQFVVDPADNRRGPYNLGGGFQFHVAMQSQFHHSARLCRTCHDVSNPAYQRVGESFVLNAFDAPHDTHDPADEFPVERTYGEWSQSAFAQGPINMGGRFGGNNPNVSTCQDCHMPSTNSIGCNMGYPSRPDLARHYFMGTQTWVLDAIHDLDTSFLLWDTPAYMGPTQIVLAKARNVNMLQSASDLEVSTENGQIKVRVINQSGHKLPTGYPEGRRIWIEVHFKSPFGETLAHHGAYDFNTAILESSTTTVFEAKHGLDSSSATLAGLPEGPSFHFALNNKIFKDNRIPPRGFTNAGFESVQAEPVGISYPDGQYWHDTFYDIPTDALLIDINVWYQTASKEYIEFLKDENVTNEAGNILYDQWVKQDKGPPILMDSLSFELGLEPFIRGDSNLDNSIDLSDAITLLGWLFLGDEFGYCPIAGDSNDDSALNISDVIFTLNALFGSGAPPSAPWPDCGPDPTPDFLRCYEYPCP
ncbi:MAG: hypothetical protein GWP41_07585 [Planctomycetia bacterium]|nr:hypothetical protein [Planctomycetia bacterium]